MNDLLIGCATCANNFIEGGGPNAAGWSILFLLAVIVPVLCGVGFCMARLALRERDALDPELRDDFDPTTRPLEGRA